MNNPTNKIPRIGDVYEMDFGGVGSEQKGWRPGIVFQNNTGNAYSPNVIALPVTSSLKKTRQPTHVLLKSKDTGLKVDSMVLCENPSVMSKERIGNYITTLSDEYMEMVAEASILASSAISFISMDRMNGLYQKANKLNCIPS